MNSEESYNPYHSLDEVPQAMGWSPGDTPSRSSPGMTESTPISERHRAWVLLILPTIFLLIITGLFCFMLLWLLHRQANVDPSFASVTTGALITDETAQWCRLSAVVSRANCDKPKEGQNLLGLALSGLLVSHNLLVDNG